MKIGTKSILFGVHQFALHPLFVAWAWWKVYGFPWDPRLWFAFFLHDLGYWGKPNLDGPEGERHVEFGAKVMHWLFDWPRHLRESPCGYCGRAWPGQGSAYYGPSCSAADGCGTPLNNRWLDFCLYHSRFYAKRDGQPFSRLCVADKLVPALMPTWFYLLLGNLSGEIHEYMHLAKDADGDSHNGKYVHMNIYSPRQAQWHRNVSDYLRRWVDEHKDGRADSWTRIQRTAADDTGVYT